MTTAKEKKELTVKQYEFYKKQINPMTDKKIMQIHGLDNNQFYAWKKKHNLIGAKFEPAVKVSDVKTTVPAKSEEALEESITETLKLLKENDIPAERLEKVSEPVKETAELTVSDDSIQKDDLTPSEPAPTLKQAFMGEIEPLSIEWYQARYDEDTKTIHELKTELAYQKERGNKLADELVKERREHRETHAEVLNLKNEIRIQDEQLVKGEKDERLLFMVMDKAIELKSKLLEGEEV